MLLRRGGAGLHQASALGAPAVHLVAADAVHGTLELGLEIEIGAIGLF